MLYTGLERAGMSFRFNYTTANLIAAALEFFDKIPVNSSRRIFNMGRWIGAVEEENLL